VKLRPGESVGWHSTTEHEEALVVLRGKGTVKIEGRRMCRCTRTCLRISRLRPAQRDEHRDGTARVCVGGGGDYATLIPSHDRLIVF